MPRRSGPRAHAWWRRFHRLCRLIGRLPPLLRDLDKDIRLVLSLTLIVWLALLAGFATIREAEHRLLKSVAIGADVHGAEFLQTRLGHIGELLAAGLVCESDRRTLAYAGATGRGRDYTAFRAELVVPLS